jgi:hypothetical protein
MRKSVLATTMACLAILSASAVQAQSIEEKHIAKGKFKFDEQAGYIFLHGQMRQVGLFLKQPST